MKICLTFETKGKIEKRRIKEEKEKRKMIKIVWEFIQFMFYSGLIVVISKYALVPVLRKLAESLNLKPKTVGNIAGVATSVPELLTVTFAAATGLVGASVYNIISSNVINTVQYSLAIFLNKNQKHLQNRALKIDLFLVAFTIVIPVLMLAFKMEFEISIVPIFLLLFVFFYFINHNVHKLYLNQLTEEEKKIAEEEKWVRGKKNVMVKYGVLLLIISILLYVIGNLLSNTLENLCLQFQVPQVVIGILLGFITSIPELITFFEAQRHYKQQESGEEGVIEATSNLLTSNILNLFVIQSIGIIIFYLFGK